MSNFKTRTAEAAFNDHLSKTLSELEVLKEKIEKIQAEFIALDKKNWGYAGTMDYVHETIFNLNLFIN